MECPQFHQLILYLHHDLQDTDIPHHTKTHELILQHWRECFMQLRVELKIGHFTMDNVTNNDTAMVVFMRILQEECKFDIDPVAHHIHCFPHIFNICIQHLINGYKCADFSGLLRTWGNPPRVLHKKEYIMAAIDLWVRMPWNTNLVLEKLEQMHWEVLQDLEFALQAPATAHHTMTSEHIPSLSGALPTYETFLKQWKRISMSSTNPQFGPLLKEGLAHGERYHKQMHANKAYVFTMFAHPSICFSWVECKWCNEISSVKASILELVKYHTKYANDNAQPTPTTMQPAYMGLASLYGLDTMEITPMAQEQGQLSIKEDFGSYIATTSQVDANVLTFWELECARLPMIYCITMDYLPVQPSSVLCEHIFSLSAETNTKKQNCISPMLMEALQLLKFSLKQDRFHFTRCREGSLPTRGIVLFHCFYLLICLMFLFYLLLTIWTSFGLHKPDSHLGYLVHSIIITTTPLETRRRESGPEGLGLLFLRYQTLLDVISTFLGL
ncbi:hypothetical protein PISMIDRAFT_105384 [Pisolithus microcarpus 441]|uniref:HAT C-terminal dimerisation domain-containing protein n=1 Tax=Pisolithus microcarpus 441 TaxID=765257 RepID=A0A0C9YV47_9AGAM|nr:hypothetical protein PISMIDRAFT_105384 [Pisolithus microcarpus 441]